MTPVAVSIDILDEDRSLVAAMRRLAEDRAIRDDLGQAGHHLWSANHTLEHMASDYLKVIEDAAARHAPQPTDLPYHFTNDYSDAARAISDTFGIRIDILDQ